MRLDWWCLYLCLSTFHHNNKNKKGGVLMDAGSSAQVFLQLGVNDEAI
jgi:hypothetical protein